MAKKGTWKRRIKAACEEAGTYKPVFDIFIEQLAWILETRDAAQKSYKENGGTPIVEHTNKSGFTNVTKNPALAVINDCNQQALTYWRDLGLTPAGFKKISGETAGAVADSFEEVLSKIGI